MRHLKKIILKGRGFRRGSDEKMMRMWFGLEIDVVGLPPLLSVNVKTEHKKVMVTLIKLNSMLCYAKLQRKGTHLKSNVVKFIHRLEILIIT